MDSIINPKDRFELAKRLIGDLFSVNIQRVGDDILVPVQDYLIRAANFHEREWNLVNRRVSNGQVYLTRHEAVRLLRIRFVHSGKNTLCKNTCNADELKHYVQNSYAKNLQDLVTGK